MACNKYPFYVNNPLPFSVFCLPKLYSPLIISPHNYGPFAAPAPQPTLLWKPLCFALRTRQPLFLPLSLNLFWYEQTHPLFLIAIARWPGMAHPRLNPLSKESPLFCFDFPKTRGAPLWKSKPIPLCRRIPLLCKPACCLSAFFIYQNYTPL